MAFSTHDIVPDSPTNNFATLNSITSSSGTYSDGNLRIAADDTDVHLSTIACPIGLISYFETIPVSTSNREIVGFSTGDSAYVIYYYNWQDNDTRIIWESVNGTGSYISGHLNNDITGKLIGLSLDLSGTYINLKMYVDGTLLVNQTTNTLVSSITKPIFPLVQSASGAFTFYTNFGQDPSFGGAKSPTTTYTDANGIGAFYYQPPTGALALCTANLPDFTPTVTGDVPQDYFKAVIWTGQTTGGDMTWDGTTGTVTVGFQPDLVWGKNRDFANDNEWTDSVRGATRSIYSNTTGTEGVNSEKLKSFDSNGFSIGNAQGYNKSGDKHVAWCWKAGGAPSGSTSTTGSAKRINTSGTQDDTSCSALATAATNAGASNVITPTLMSINQAAGFSIVKYVGAQASSNTVPHGLIKKPEFIICKDLDRNSHWFVLAEGMSNTPWSGRLLFDSGAYAADPLPWANTEPSDSYVTLGASSYTNWSNINYIMYCWHSVEGYSKFGSYTGNGSADGPFVYCGFRPAFVMIKQSSASGEGWYIVDTARDTYNAMGTILIANSSGGDNTSQYPFVDYVSNGFKLRKSWGGVNGSSTTYIFMAFAEQPFKFSNAR